MSKRKVGILVVAGIVAIAAAAGVALYVFANEGAMSTTTPPTASQSTADTKGLNTVSKDLEAPWSIVFYNDIPLVSLRDTGEILELDQNGNSRIVGTIDNAVHRGEGGLLGLAVDKQSRLYAYYTTSSDNRISRFTIEGDRGNLSLGNPKTILEGLPSASFHNGGRIAFGPDGQLYVTVGDAGNTTSAQEKGSFGGKILRMTPDGDVPTDNPFSGSIVYSYGHRNPQGLAWSDNGTMYATEFGQNAWDELNIIKPGANYGWPVVEGIEQREGFTVPVQQWATNNASPSGMAYADGRLYIANLRGELLRVVPINNISTHQDNYSGEYGRMRDVVVAPNGKLWFMTNNTDGRGSPSETDDRILSVPLSELN